MVEVIRECVKCSQEIQCSEFSMKYQQTMWIVHKSAGWKKQTAEEIFFLPDFHQ